MIKSLVKLALRIFPRTFLIRSSYLVRPFLVFFLRGDRFTDPIDGKSFSSFLPYGYEVQRKQVLSPSTLSLERHRLLWLYLRDYTDLFSKPHRVLHFAPEQAFYSRLKNMPHLEYITTDLNSPLADVKADICDLPFENETFDFILCNHVLEHIKDDKKAMRELYRVLTPGGVAITQVPQDLTRESTFEDDSITDPRERARIFGQYDHVRIYGRDFFNTLREIGFVVAEVDLTKDMSPELVDRYRLAPGELIPVSQKPL